MGHVPDSFVDQRFRFERCGDRFAQHFQARLGNELVAVLESVEPSAAATGSQDWPASPPLQDWHFETRDEAAIFLAVGRAGKTHWSVAIEIGNDEAIRCDIAARVYVPPGFLGSTYLCPAGCRQLDDTQVELLPGVRLTCDRETSRLRFDAATQTLVIEPLPHSASKWPQTIRWRFAVHQSAP